MTNHEFLYEMNLYDSGIEQIHTASSYVCLL